MAIDEDTLNVLLAEGESLPVAVSGSIVDDPQTQRPGRKASRLWVIAGAVCGLIFALILRSWLW
jgi:hypothetical protein